MRLRLILPLLLFSPTRSHVQFSHQHSRDSLTVCISSPH